MTEHTAGEYAVRYRDEWNEVRQQLHPDGTPDGRTYLHEHHRGGMSIAVLPWRRRLDGLQYLLKSEITQSWHLEPELSAITGGCDVSSGMVDVRADAVRELREETGYVRERHNLRYLGMCRGAKALSTTYYLFSVGLGVDLTPGEILGDGTRDEWLYPAQWTPESVMPMIVDPLVSVMWLRHYSPHRPIPDMFDAVPYPA